MKPRLYLCLALLAFLAADAPQDPSPSDLELLQGTWVLESGERDGKKVPDDQLGKATVVSKGNKYKITAGIGTATRGTFTIDPDKSPKWLDATAAAGPDKGKTWLGIYTVDGTTHRACLAPPGQPRPEKFASPADSGVIDETWTKQQKKQK